MPLLDYNGHSMVAALRRALVCSPEAAGWTNGSGSQALGFLRPPDAALARRQHQQLCQELQAAGAEVVSLQPDSETSLDAVYTHDPSFLTDWGALILNPGKANRVPEARVHHRFYQDAGIPILGEMPPPATAEAGDMLWLDDNTLLVGRGYRTNQAGIAWLRATLAPRNIQVISAPLPHAAGPGCCLHLMSLISLLDENTALVDLPWLATETVELLCERRFRLIEIQPEERDTLACNVLALGNRKLLAIAENVQTNDRLRAAGFDVRTFPGSEISFNGSGGPTCLTRPLLRL